jgi:Family of unknown function (DUF5678)
MESLQLNELEQQMADDLHWASRAAEVRQHAGKLVAIHKKRVVGVGSDRDALVAQAAEKAKCGWHEIVVFVVPGTGLSETPR